MPETLSQLLSVIAVMGSGVTRMAVPVRRRTPRPRPSGASPGRRPAAPVCALRQVGPDGRDPFHDRSEAPAIRVPRNRQEQFRWAFPELVRGWTGTAGYGCRKDGRGAEWPSAAAGRADRTNPTDRRRAAGRIALRGPRSSHPAPVPGVIMAALVRSNGTAWAELALL